MKRLGNDYLKKLREQADKHYAGIPALNWGEMINGKYEVMNRYDFVWKYATGDTKSLVPLKSDLHEYILKFKESCAKEGRAVTAFVGTDSQNHMSYTRFVTALCLMVERNGVHVIVSKMDMPKIYDYRYRLLRETDVTSEFIRNHKDFFKGSDMSLTIHADYNAGTNHKSNGVVTEATNYVKTHGYNLEIKPLSFGASYAADHFC